MNASTASGEGGNITLNTDNLELLNQSQITASAGGQGNGGNITIDSNTILGIQNSDITANAIGGDGGNITIDSDFVVGLQERSQLTPESDITATSEFGIDGSVTINAPDSNLGDDAIAIFKDYVQSNNQELLESACNNVESTKKGKLVYVGRGGIPANPYNFFGDEDVVVVQGTSENEQSDRDKEIPLWVEGDPIINSNAVRVGANGEKYLVAERSLENAELDVCVREAH